MYYTNNLMKIKSESFASRCEICHQSDCFNPATNDCFRCQFINILQVPDKNIPVNRFSYLLYLALNLSITTLSYGFLWKFHPILRFEPIELFFLPMTVITTFLFFINYKFLAYKATVFRQILTFYGTFLLALVLYSIYLTVFLISNNSPIIDIHNFLSSGLFMLLIILFFGHIFGSPTLVFIIFINNFLNKYFSSFLFGSIRNLPKIK